MKKDDMEERGSLTGGEHASMPPVTKKTRKDPSSSSVSRHRRKEAAITSRSRENLPPGQRDGARGCSRGCPAQGIRRNMTGSHRLPIGSKSKPDCLEFLLTDLCNFRSS